MKLFLVLVVISIAHGRLLQYKGKDLFLNGPNIAWHNYGHDFGDNSWGNDYDSKWWDNTLNDVQAHGANSIRTWVHCQGEFSPIFKNGHCSNQNPNLLNNLKDMLQRAHNHKLLVVLNLFDFLIVKTGRHDIIIDTSKTQSYINNCLIPMLKELDYLDNLVAYEIFNEPEWILENYKVVQTHELQRFVAMVAEAVHNHSTKLFTVGSASLKWNSDVSPAVGNLWSDQALQKQYQSSKSHLDFYQIHYYDWMSPYYSPFESHLEQWKLDKPTIIGESGDQGKIGFSNQYETALKNGWAGMMGWAYNANDQKFGFQNFKDHMKNFRTNHPQITDF